MIVPNLSDEHYRAAPGLSQSSLKQLTHPGGPAKVRFGPPPVGTRAQKFGTLIHTAILQPDLLDRYYAPTDIARFGTRAWLDAEVAAMGRTLVKRPEYEEALRIRDAITRWSDAARELLTPGPDLAREQSAFWQEPTYGYSCKGRVDAVHASYRALIDIKSCEDASEDGFWQAARKWGYFVQAAFYLDGWALAGGFAPEEFVLLAVEKTAPYLAAAYTLDPADIAAGRAEIARLLAIYHECETSGLWPGYHTGLLRLTPLTRSTS